MKRVLSPLCGPALASVRALQFTPSKPGWKIFQGRASYVLKTKFLEVSLFYLQGGGGCGGLALFVFLFGWVFMLWVSQTQGCLRKA